MERHDGARVIALLCWWNEDPHLLVQCLAGLAKAGTRHVVAVDGAYSLVPGATAASDPNQQGAIVMACRELGMDCTVHVPSTPWADNEVGKRQFLFDLGWSLAKDGDWFWVQDADQIVTRCPDNLPELLALTTAETAEVEFLDVVAQRAAQADWPPRFVVRSLFRAQPITVGPAHCNYKSADGRALWNGPGGVDGTNPLDLSSIVEVEHRPDARTHERQAAKMQFYALRDESGIERGDCFACGEQGVRLVAHGWRTVKGFAAPVADWHEYCETHARKMEARSKYELRNLGVDPDAVSVENRNGRAPDRQALV